jgi:hypothetical protein
MRGELSQDDRSDQIVVHLTQAELLLLAGSVNEVIEVVEDWEFSARLGADSEPDGAAGPRAPGGSPAYLGLLRPRDP